ncbi:hypothetical protein TNCV_2784391 [Trichonephila clavipes]|nr:hypothetical protein TNCV_2784391 [Trichonephila clavipes]
MEQGSTKLAMGYVPQQPSRQFGQTVLQAVLLLQKLNACSINNLKKHLASGLPKRLSDLRCCSQALDEESNGS